MNTHFTSYHIKITLHSTRIDMKKILISVSLTKFLPFHLFGLSGCRDPRKPGGNVYCLQGCARVTDPLPETAGMGKHCSGSSTSVYKYRQLCTGTGNCTSSSLMLTAYDCPPTGAPPLGCTPRFSAVVTGATPPEDTQLSDPCFLYVCLKLFSVCLFFIPSLP